MKTSSKFLALLAVSAFALLPVALHAQDQPPPPPDSGAPPPDASGGDDSGASFQEFYDQLGSQGQWIQTDNYGYAFQPTVTDPDWAPYTDGHWAYTDVGWTWVSDEPWGWATYHYGRWVNIDGTGWVWVPGYTWAPAWVSWRYGGGYCGWAPLPPATLVGVDFASPGVNIGIGWFFGSDVDVNFGIGAGCYNFIPESYIGESRYHGYYLDRSRNFVVINQTTNITNVRYYSGRPVFGGVTVGGPSFAEINAHARTPMQQMHLAAAGGPGRSSIAGGTLNIYAPRVNPATFRQARPTTIARTLTAVKVNRGTSISHPLMVNASLKPAAPSAAAIQAAKEAQAKIPSSAHIATARTVPKTTLSKPLTSLQPATEIRRSTPAAAVSASHPVGQPATQERDQALRQEPTQTQPHDAGAQAQRDQALKQEPTQAQARDTAAQDERASALQQQQAQARERDTAAQDERAKALQQEQAEARERATATEEQRAAVEQRAAIEQRAASEERAPVTQERTPVEQQRAPVEQQRAPVEQQRAPVQQERAPAPAQRPAAAPAGGQKPKNANGQ